MEELTKEEAIRRHRLMWNWIAEEAEKGKLVTKKDAFKHFGWNATDTFAMCWCCEWAHIEQRRNEELGIDFESRCCICPLDWSNDENEIIKTACTANPTYDGIVHDGLYDVWWSKTYMEEDPTESSRLARIIANLPEKKEVQNND